jgi:rhamnulokinase
VGIREVAPKVVACCTHDTGSAVVAVPAEDTNDWAYLSSGTWSLIGVELPMPLMTDEARVANFTNELGFGGKVRLLKNIIGLWLLQECRRHWNEEGSDLDYSELTRLAQEAEPLRSMIQPDDPRFLPPGDMPDRIRAFCRESGQPEPQTPGQFARCILESLALLYAVRLEELEQLTRRSIRTLHIVGGGSFNRLLNQFAANATGRVVLAGPVEATAIGNLMVQAIAVGDVADLPAARKIVSDSFLVERFEPDGDDAWSAARERFATLKLPALGL